ncbi:MAG: hypothetical protein WAW86_06740 [Gammaproteobacteria bacterium]
MNPKALQAVLENLFKDLKKQGYEIKNAPELIKNIIKKLGDEKVILFDSDLAKTDVKKSLQVACLAEANPMNKFDYTMLFKSQKDINEKTLALELKNVLKEALLLKPGNKLMTDRELDELAQKLSKAILQNKNDDDLVCEKNGVLAMVMPCVEIITQQLSDQRRRDYGVDTTISGGEFIPVFQAPLSDNTSILPAFGKSYEGEKLDPEIGKPDPLGIKDLIISPNEEKEIIKQLNEKLIDAGVIPSSAPRPKPPGSIAG